MKQGYLIINLGTPDSPQPKEVGTYLKEFLMDPFVVDINGFFRWILVYLLIVPKRSKESAALYQNIWTEEGSPLLVYSKKLIKKLIEKFEKTPIELGMRYGSPSLEEAIDKLLQQGVDKITICPLYPQYALSSTATCLVSVQKALRARSFQGEARYLRSFYDHPNYLQAMANSIKPYLESSPDMIVFSYHGLPEHQVSATGTRCEFNSSCCTTFKSHSPDCYRAQCYHTTNKVLEALNWPKDKTTVVFQSRLGRRPWLKPYADDEIKKIAESGAKNIVVSCPSFTADCLETLEEISFRMKDDFINAGGESLTLVPSLNDNQEWVDAIPTLWQDSNTTLLRDFTPDARGAE